MNSSSLARLQEISERASGLRRTFDDLKAAWPEGAEFRGSDASGALTVTISSKGDVVQVDLAADWQKRIDERSLARAINEAVGAASVPLADQWLDDLDEQGVEEAPRASTRPRLTLEEYRRRYGTPHTLEDLAPAFDRLAAARAEYDRSQVQLRQLAGHERFESPRGFFRVTRSRANLLALEYEKGDFTFRSTDEVQREIVASLDEIRRRAAEEQAEFDASFPALAAIRAEDAER